MKVRTSTTVALALALGLLSLFPASSRAQVAAGDAPRLTLDDIFASSTFSSERFRGGRWADEGPVVTYIDEDEGATHLTSYNLETDARERLLDGSRLYADDVERIIEIEDYTYGPDGRRVLLYTDSAPVWRYNTQGYYYVYDLEAQELLPVADRETGYQQFAKFSPDGSHIAFVRDRNLYLVDLETMTETALTSNGAPGTIINGTSDWVYEEEFGLRDAWAWSPEGRYIAFVQLDESATRDFVMADLRDQYPELERFRYPKAGEANSEVRVGIVDVTTRDTLFFDTDTWREGGTAYEYIPVMGWTPAVEGTHYVWMIRMNRDQNVLDVLYGDPATGEVRTVLHEESETWLEVETGFTDLETGAITFLDDGEHFVWISERDGYRHLYLYKNNGTFVRQLTRGEWDVTNFHGVDLASNAVYFNATAASPLERQLYRVPFQPHGDGIPAPERITRRSGSHGIDLSRDFAYYIDTFSNITTPAVVSLHRITGESVKALETNEALAETMLAYDLPAPEFTEIPGADGVPLNAFVIKPADFEASKSYPVLMYVYGGPGSQTVKNAWGGGRGSRYLWHQYLAQELGVIVVSVDNRGTGARGNAFKTATYKQLGLLEAQDQIAAARHLARLPYVDAERIGIWGWSYGGYMTLMSMLYEDGPRTFKVGMSVAPVTDWRQYDTIYTERYMSTPQANAEGYTAAAPLTYADRLGDDQQLLIVHGDLDDNVHFQNAVHMIDGLQQEGKQFDMMIYPGRDHGISGGPTRLHLFTYLTRYVQQHLAEDSVPLGTH